MLGLKDQLFCRGRIGRDGDENLPGGVFHALRSFGGPECAVGGDLRDGFAEVVPDDFLVRVARVREGDYLILRARGGLEVDVEPGEKSDCTDMDQQRDREPGRFSSGSRRREVPHISFCTKAGALAGKLAYYFAAI